MECVQGDAALRVGQPTSLPRGVEIRELPSQDSEGLNNHQGRWVHKKGITTNSSSPSQFTMSFGCDAGVSITRRPSRSSGFKASGGSWNAASGSTGWASLDPANVTPAHPTSGGEAVGVFPCPDDISGEEDGRDLS
ncbi:unnamed protein product [Linum trigynum]|uniref:Uncharacterized protein n=1 Tax=Linum trigynum TaxID=586398 RepID=A0AAV2EUT2_9ROSI